jgi:predicted Ser/Thr protein kinase
MKTEAVNTPLTEEERTQLKALLSVDSVHGEVIPLLDFLLSLREHPDRVGTAHSLVLRAITEDGEVEYEKFAPLRQPRLKLLKALGVPTYKSFADLPGTQLLVYEIVKWLEAAAAGGYQGNQMIVFKGKPGTGKSLIIDRISELIEGRPYWAVKDCPSHENPLNLLKMLKRDAVKKLGKALNLEAELPRLMRRAKEPCAHCKSRLRELGHASHESGTAPLSASLEAVQVEQLRISSGFGGNSVWTPSAKGSKMARPLAESLLEGSRGLARLQEAFDAGAPVDGDVSELQVLLEATDRGRINGALIGKVGFIPSDCVIMLETNEDAWNAFLTQKDADKFTDRSRVLRILLNAAVAEEVVAYQNYIEQHLDNIPLFDPLALTVAASLAIATRLVDEVEDPTDTSAPGKRKRVKVPVNKRTRLRLYNGENVSIERALAAANFERKNDGPFGGRALSVASSEDKNAQKNMLADLWRLVEKEEGAQGLNMRFMLSGIGALCELAFSQEEKTVCAIDVIKYFRMRLDNFVMQPELHKPEDVELYQRCREMLVFARTPTDKVGLVEKEYRRLLRTQVLGCFSPGRESRAQQMFTKYRLHAQANAEGKTTFIEKGVDKEPHKVETDFLEKIENQMGRSFDKSSRQEFRQGLSSEFVDIIREQAKEQGDSDLLALTWQSHPDIKKAILAILDLEIAEKLERLLDENMLGFKNEEKKLRLESLERFSQLGYNPHSLKVALEYFKNHELWKSSSEDSSD